MNSKFENIKVSIADTGDQHFDLNLVLSFLLANQGCEVPDYRPCFLCPLSSPSCQGILRFHFQL